MAKKKAALFVDNSNIFKGREAFSRELYHQGKLKKGEFLRVVWDKLISSLEQQEGGIEILPRHFFASIGPSSDDLKKLTHRPTEEEWLELVRQSTNRTAFFEIIQRKFNLHIIPLHFAYPYCRDRILQAYYACGKAQAGHIKCGLKVNVDDCKKCRRKFLFQYEKGVDVALAVQLVLACQKDSGLDQIILASGDGDYKDALSYVRNVAGIDVQLVVWRQSLSAELIKLANKPTVFLDDNWTELCEKKKLRPLAKGIDDIEVVSEEDRE